MTDLVGISPEEIYNQLSKWLKKGDFKVVSKLSLIKEQYQKIQELKSSITLEEAGHILFGGTFTTSDLTALITLVEAMPYEVLLLSSESLKIIKPTIDYDKPNLVNFANRILTEELIFTHYDKYLTYKGLPADIPKDWAINLLLE
jgi:hypothetical protein